MNPEENEPSESQNHPFFGQNGWFRFSQGAILPKKIASVWVAEPFMFLLQFHEALVGDS